MDVTGKTAIVTGSAVGVGRAVALDLAKRGANVVINYSRSEDDAKEAVRLVEQAGARALLVKADVSDDAQVRAMIAKTVETFGALHALEPAGPVVDPFEVPGGWRVGEPAWTTWRMLVAGHEPVDVRVRGRAAEAEVVVGDTDPALASWQQSHFPDRWRPECGFADAGAGSRRGRSVRRRVRRRRAPGAGRGPRSAAPPRRGSSPPPPGVPRTPRRARTPCAPCAPRRAG